MVRGRDQRQRPEARRRGRERPGCRGGLAIAPHSSWCARHRRSPASRRGRGRRHRRPSRRRAFRLRPPRPQASPPRSVLPRSPPRSTSRPPFAPRRPVQRAASAGCANRTMAASAIIAPRRRPPSRKLYRARVRSVPGPRGGGAASAAGPGRLPRPTARPTPRRRSWRSGGASPIAPPRRARCPPRSRRSRIAG